MATLGELLQAKGDADYAGGGEGGAISPDLYSSAAANEYLQHAADLTYNAHRYLAEQHDRNMQQELQGLNGVDFKDLLPQDQQALMPEYGGVTQDIANNFGVVRNPMSNPQAWAALKNSESSIRQRLSQAQSDAAFINKQNEFVQLHPEFNTPDFQQKKAQFLATPVGQRQPFVVTPPLTYNPATAYKTIAELAKKKQAMASTNGKYITQEERETIDPDQYAKLAQQLPGTDQYGNSIEAARRAAYDKLPANLKPATYQDFVNQEAQLYRPQDQVTKKDIKADEFGTIKAQGAENRRTIGMEEAFQGNQNELNRENALVVAGMKTEKLNPQTAAEAKMRNLAVIENTGNIDPSLAQSLYGDNSKIKVATTIPLPDDPNEKDPSKISFNNKNKKTITSDAPVNSFINSNIDENGNLHLNFRDNQTGAQLPEKIITHTQLYNDLDGMYGEKFKPQLAGASGAYSQKAFGKSIPTIEDLRNHYGINQSTVPDNVKSKVSTEGTPGQVAPIKSQAEYDALPKGAQYIDPTDGKTYIKK